MNPRLNGLLACAAELGASDLQLMAGSPPAFHVAGEIILADQDDLSQQECNAMSLSLLNETQQQRLEQDWQLCLSIHHAVSGQIQATFYRRNGITELSCRFFTNYFPSRDESGPPVRLDELTRKQTERLLPSTSKNQFLMTNKTKPVARILLVEDDEAIRETTADLLILDGYVVDCASGGDEAVQYLTNTEELPDLILSDIMMAQGDGYLLLAQTQTHQHLQAIPLIFISARADKSDVRTGMSTGANDYLTKPFTLKDLREAISCQLKNSRRHLAQFTQLRLQIAESLPHELRTPLCGISCFVDLLAADARGQPTLSSHTVLESCGRIGDSTRRLHKQIQLLTMWVEIITQPAKVTAHFQANPATAWTSATSAKCRNLASEQDRTGDFSLQLEPAGLQMAASYVSTLVLELLENAFKFSTKGTPVKVNGRRLTAAEYELTVQNEGLAFTPEQVCGIAAFCQFGRADFAQQGLGIGLAIVFHLCALVRSKPTIVSQAGVTLVRVRIPMWGLEATLADPAELKV